MTVNSYGMPVDERSGDLPAVFVLPVKDGKPAHEHMSGLDARIPIDDGEPVAFHLHSFAFPNTQQDAWRGVIFTALPADREMLVAFVASVIDMEGLAEEVEARLEQWKKEPVT